jgi:hypothetical protein
MVAQLLSLQPGYKMAAIKQFFDKGKRPGFDPSRFSGVSITYKSREYTPQQWYRWIDGKGAIAANHKQDVKLYIFSAYYLRGLRNAVASHKADKVSVLHRGGLGLDYGPYYLFRVILKCLAARFPNNVNFDENMWGERLLQMTKGKLIRSNLPPYVEPQFPRPKQEIPLNLLYTQITGRSLLRKIWPKILGGDPKDDPTAFEEWGNNSKTTSLIYTVLSAKALYPKMWEKELRTRDVTLTELSTYPRKQKAWLRRNI